jgi:hypothetical protein
LRRPELSNNEVVVPEEEEEQGEEGGGEEEEEEEEEGKGEGGRGRGLFQKYVIITSIVYCAILVFYHTLLSHLTCCTANKAIL